MDVKDREEMDMSDILRTIDKLYTMETKNITEEKGAEGGEEDDAANEYSVKSLESRGFRDEQIQEIQKGIDQLLLVHHYAKDCYNWMQMREIRLGLLEEVDTKRYENPLYNAEQMREIRMGLAGGLNVDSYAKLILTAADMAKERRRLLQNRYSTNPEGFAREKVDDETGIKVRISDDCMRAFVTVPENNDLSVREIKRVMAKNDVVYGIMDKALEDIIKNKKYGQEIQAAQGEKAKNGVDGKYEYFFNPLLPGKPKVLEDGSVDYTEVVEADKVSAGDVLATYCPGTEGRGGRTVMGMNVPAQSGRALLPFTGTGFKYDRNTGTYTATTDGFVVSDEQKGTMNVWNVYVVEGDVNRYTGHITYDGIIHIKGSVGDMASIEANGNIVVDGLVGGAHLIAGGNVIIKGGANGGSGGSGYIQAGRKIMGRFFEAMELTAGGDIEGNYFMNCQIETDARVIARGSKGRILGGDIKAMCGIEAMIIGNNSGTRTVLDVANPVQYEKREKKLLMSLGKVEDELSQLKEGKDKLCKIFGDIISEKNDIYHKTCLAIELKEQQKKEIDDELTYIDDLKRRSQKAYIRAFGSLSEGVVVGIHGKRRMLQETVGKITIRNLK